MASGIDCIAVFWMSPYTTCAAMGSELSLRIRSLVWFKSSNPIGCSPNPFGTMIATGTSPARTAASPESAVELVWTRSPPSDLRPSTN